MPFGAQAGGGVSRVTKASARFSFRASFDPTSSTQILLGYVPNNARVVDIVSEGGGTGGTNPTVDIGTAGDDDGFANELKADGVSSAVAAGKTGALWGTLLTGGPTAIYGKVGASAAGGGTTTVQVVWTSEEA